MTEVVLAGRERASCPLPNTDAADEPLPSDEAVLECYQTARSPEALAQIVRRHRPMVFRTCFRLLSHLHDAEDATQQVFLIIAQRPGMVRRSVVGCLHELARAAAAEMRRSRERRSRREEVVARMNAIFARLQASSSPAQSRELQEELDAALAQLPDDFRQAVILRYLEGRSQQEAACLAGCSQGAIGWRSMKGLDRLRAILERRGVQASLTALAAGLAAEARAAGFLNAGAAAAGWSTPALGASLGGWLHHLLLWCPGRRQGLLLFVVAAFGLTLAGVALLGAASHGDGKGAGETAASKAAAANAPLDLGLFTNSRDIGRPGLAGSVRRAGDSYIVRGGGSQIYGPSDQFQFVYRTLDGDGEISACVSNVDRHAGQALAGVMIRDSLEANSRHAGLFICRGGQFMCKYRGRECPGSQCVSAAAPASQKHWLRLVRRGNTLTGYVRSKPSDPWKQIVQKKVALNSVAYVGLAVTAHDNKQIVGATFDDVAVSEGGR
jgi:RNA polymerase sigma factor (sigma-70 family)